MRAYVPPGWSRRERDRLAQRLLVPNDRTSRLPLVALVVVVALIAIAGFTK